MDVMQLNPVINGGKLPQWDKVSEVLRSHKNLASLLRIEIRDYLEHLDRVERTHKSHRTRYERAIEETRKRLRANRRAIHTIKRYGLLDLPRGLELPIIPYILKATAKWVDVYDIDLEVEHGMAGFIAVNRRTGQHFRRDLHRVIDFISTYGDCSNEEGRKRVVEIKEQIFRVYFSMLGQIMDRAFLGEQAQDHYQEPKGNAGVRLRAVK